MTQRGGRPSCLAAENAFVPDGKSVWCGFVDVTGEREGEKRAEVFFSLSENKLLKERVSLLKLG